MLSGEGVEKGERVSKNLYSQHLLFYHRIAGAHFHTGATFSTFVLIDSIDLVACFNGIDRAFFSAGTTDNAIIGNSVCHAITSYTHVAYGSKRLSENSVRSVIGCRRLLSDSLPGYISINSFSLSATIASARTVYSSVIFCTSSW